MLQNLFVMMRENRKIRRFHTFDKIFFFIQYTDLYSKFLRNIITFVTSSSQALNRRYLNTSDGHMSITITISKSSHNHLLCPYAIVEENAIYGSDQPYIVIYSHHVYLVKYINCVCTNTYLLVFMVMCIINLTH